MIRLVARLLVVLLVVTGPFGAASAQLVPDPGAGALPAESPPSHLRSALLPDPDVFTRADQLAIVIQAMLDQLARGRGIGPDLRTAYAVLSNDAPLPEAMDPDMATPVSTLAYIAARGPAPEIADVTQADLEAIVQHILDTPGDRYGLHYMDLFVTNTAFGARDLITGPFANGTAPPTAAEIVARAMNRDPG